MNRATRRRLAAELADDHDGVVHRRALLAAGVGRHELRTELRCGYWSAVGRNTISPDGSELRGRAPLWRAVWEAGPRAILDGAAALIGAGMRQFDASVIDVWVPPNARAHRGPGVRLHRRRIRGALDGAGVPRLARELAVLNAARWAVSDTQAALLVCLPVQQRLIHPEALLAAWLESGRRPMRLDLIITTVCAGAESLGELDFARLCVRAGLPAPSRQVPRAGPRGAVYLDCHFDEHNLVVEIDGAQHGWGLNPLQDQLRSNELVLQSDRVLRIPLLGLRLDPAPWLEQVRRALDLREAS
ncbi:hypothetical protein [Naumannella huperziae]